MRLLLRQAAVAAGKAADWGCGCFRRRCFFLVLLVGTVLLMFYTNVGNVAPSWSSGWWERRHLMRWWVKFNGESARTSQNLRPPDANGSRRNSAGPYLVEYPHRYHFVINEALKCRQQKPFVVLVVPVAPHNRADRDIVRSTWGGESSALGRAVTMVFLLGHQGGEEGEKVQDQLLEESKQHGDLIQSSFLDCYKNLTIKTMVMLEWLDAYCPGAAYAMKIDADMFLNVPNLVRMLVDAPKTNYMTGLVERGAEVHRDPGSKWYVPVELYPHDTYPRYALGLGYVLSLDLPAKLLEASRLVGALYLEDVYLGLCMQQLGIPPSDPPAGGYFYVFPVEYSRCAYSKLVATTTNPHADRLWTWSDFRRPGPSC